MNFDESLKRIIAVAKECDIFEEEKNMDFNKSIKK